MAITSVDSFIRIFKFYQSNPLVRKERDTDGKKIRSVTLQSIFRANSLIYQDTVDVYLHSLTLDKLTQLSYDTDGDTIQHAINAREKLSKYFSKVLFPGSYAYSTIDNASVRRMMLDWSSTIKTIQDANRKVTNAYSLSSNDIDKAIRGFGIDFINSTTVKSTERRKNFLLKICDLYAIKGSPDSIIQALNIIGLDDIFIREAWICKDVDKYNGDYDLRIQWKAQKLQQDFDNIRNTYVELNTHDDIFTTWDWFKEKIHDNHSTFDPHWFYTKNEIKILNNDPKTFIKLPSITPYFGIEFSSDLDKNIDSLDVLLTEINKEYQSFFLNDESKTKTIWLDTFPNRLNVLECYTGLLYVLTRVDEHIQYENLRSYLLLNKFNPPEFEPPYEHFKLINWMYQNRNEEPLSISYNKLLRDYIPIKSNTYTSYENVLKWWLESEVSLEERNLGYSYNSDDLYNTTFRYVDETIDKPIPPHDPEIPPTTENDEDISIGNRRAAVKGAIYIQPRRPSDGQWQYGNFITLEWDNIYPTGRYCVESYNKEDGWKEIVTNAYIYDNVMQCSVMTDYAEHGCDDINDFRIVIYHHPSNIPDIFFHQPFNFNAKPINTMMDRVTRYNGPLTSISFYDNDDPIKQSFINQQISDTVTNYDVISGYHEQQASGNIRVTQIHDDIKAYYCSVYNYPAKTRLYEDKWMNINNTFYDYVDWATTDYYDTITHDGRLQSNELIGRKWPLNKNWNWAIDSKYYYVNYEFNKWMRYPVSEFVTSTGIPTNQFTYGSRVIIDNKLYVYVSTNTWAVVEGIETEWDNRETDLLTNGKIKSGSKLSRTLAVGQIKNDNIIQLLHTQTDSDKTSEKYKESLRQLNQSTIEIYTEPYGNQLVTTNSYTYVSFLTYLYNNRLTLDFNTGYIYPVIEGYVDDHCRVYLKCKNDHNITKWIRFNNQRDNIEWDDCDGCETIYGSNSNIGLMLPPYSLPNRYDSERILNGRIFNYRKELLEAFENGLLSDDTNLVVVRAYDHRNAGKYEETEGEYIFNHPVVYKKIQVVSSAGSLKLEYDWVPVLENRLQECKLGVNPDLIDWIEDMLTTNAQNYVDLPTVFAEALNSYLINDLGIKESVLDLIIASWSNSDIVKKIVNYYKPKRARLLFVSDALDGEYALSNGLDTLGITDSEYNYYDLVTYRWGNPNFDTKNISKMNRQRISHVINEYMPIEDTIYKDNDDSNKLFNYREIHSPESKIPQIEVYDELVDITRQSVATRNGTASAVFYVQNLPYEKSMNGFYYQINLDGGKQLYSNNSWYFQECKFVTKYNDSGRIKVTTRWALFKSDNNICEQDYAYYVADRESAKPWISNEGDPIKYADCRAHERLIDDYLFEFGIFSTQRYIKTNLRNLDPVLYFRCFDDESCNGFYYHDEQLHPDSNEFPVYYNLKGKIIALVDTTGYYSRKDPVTKNQISKFWCVMDHMQIKEFNKCNYFAFATSNQFSNDTALWDANNFNFTKEFHKFNISNEITKLPSALVGCSIDFLYEHPDMIRDDEGIYSAEYDMYTNFRRNHYNTVGLKRQPLACLVSDGVTIQNYYNHNDNEKIIHYGDDSNIDSNNAIELTIDDIGNATGAFKTNGEVVLRSNINHSTVWSIAMRIRFEDSNSIFTLMDNATDLETNKWYMIALTCENKFFVNGKLRNDINQKFISITTYMDVTRRRVDTATISFSDCNCIIAEVGIWDEIITDWYINVISNFRILRNRPEGNKSTTAVGPSNYRPLFAQEQPRIVFDRWSTGLPENIVGGRLQEYFADKYKKNHEENPLWPNRLHHDLDNKLIVKGAALTQPSRDTINIGNEVYARGDYITDRGLKLKNIEILFNNIFKFLNKYISNNKKNIDTRIKLAEILDDVTNYFSVYSELVNDIISQNESKKKEFDSTLSTLFKKLIDICDDIKYAHDKYFIIFDDTDIMKIKSELQKFRDYKNIQWWWMRYNKDFRTGPIHHRPVYVSTKHIINDSYPTIKFGQEKKGDYYDIGLSFDGVDNIDNSCYDSGYLDKTNPNTYDDETYDENTGFGFKQNTKVKLENFGDTFKNTGSNDNTYILDLAQLTLDSESLSNFIFHDSIYLYNMPPVYNEFIGTWNHVTDVKSWRSGDFKHCYRKGDNFEAVFTYQKDTGYFWWEVRKLTNNNVWKTYFRTYANAKHNQSRLQYVYDLINKHQIDISNQQLYKYADNEFVRKYIDEDGNEHLVTDNDGNLVYKNWSEIEQIPVGTSFGSNCWAAFDIQLNSENTHPGISRYFDGNKYHICFDDKWYTVYAEKDFEGFQYLPNYKTPSGYLFANNYLYIWIEDKLPKTETLQTVVTPVTYQDHTTEELIHYEVTNVIKEQVSNPGYWIRIRCSKVTVNSQKIPYQLWSFRKLSNSVVINVIDSSNAKRSEETYVNPDIIDIQETMWKLVKFNGINDWKWEDHMNEEFPYLKSVNNDISCSIASLQDTLWYQTFEVDSNGKYIKVKFAHGITDFVPYDTQLDEYDKRVNNLRYNKRNDWSNV